mmetsp:Transcript_9252/g.16972  ORF Transcript_9252/g.16972 Transcript_9252/m.16972 type:complete len:102 (+) Transcript_9252:568-873(+)
MPTARPSSKLRAAVLRMAPFSNNTRGGGMIFFCDLNRPLRVAWRIGMFLLINQLAFLGGMSLSYHNRVAHAQQRHKAQVLCEETPRVAPEETYSYIQPAFK